MTENLRELVDDPRKASIIFDVILSSENPDIIQRTLELYVLLILHHADAIQKALDNKHDQNQEYEQIIDRLEQQQSELEQENARLDRLCRNRDYFDHTKKERWTTKTWEEYKHKHLF